MQRWQLRTLFLLCCLACSCSWVTAITTAAAEEPISTAAESGEDEHADSTNDGVNHLQQHEESSSPSPSSSSSSSWHSVEEIKAEISRCTNSDCIMHWAQLLEEKKKASTVEEKSDKKIGDPLGPEAGKDNDDGKNEGSDDTQDDGKNEESDDTQDDGKNEESDDTQDDGKNEESNDTQDDGNNEESYDTQDDGKNEGSDDTIYIKDIISLDTSVSEDHLNSSKETDPLVEEVVQEYLDDTENGPNRTVSLTSSSEDENSETKIIPQKKQQKDVEEETAREHSHMSDTEAGGSVIGSVQHKRLEENGNVSSSDKEDNKDDKTESEMVSVAELSVDVILKESNIKNDEVHTFPDGQIMTADGVVRPAPVEENNASQDTQKNNEYDNSNAVNDSHNNSDSDDGKSEVFEGDKVGNNSETETVGKSEKSSPPPPPPKRELSAKEIQARRSADGYLAMASAYNEKQDYETALKQTAKAIKRDKSYPDIYVIQGKLHAATGQVNEAVDDFLLLFELSPGNTTAVKYLMNIARQVYVYKMHEMVTKCLLPVYETINSDMMGNLTVYIDEENRKNMTSLYHDSGISLLLAASLMDQKNYSIALGVLRLNDLLSDGYMTNPIATDTNATDTNKVQNESKRNDIAKARINLYISVYEQLDMLDDAEMLLQETIESSNGNDFTWIHLADFNARQNRTERAIFYYEKVLAELEEKMAKQEQAKESNDEEDSGSRKHRDSDISADTSSSVNDLGDLKVQIALVHKKLGGVYTKVNITKALDHFDNAVNLGMLDAEIRKFYAGEEYRNVTSAAPGDSSSKEDAHANDQTNGKVETKNLGSSSSSHEIPRINHRYRWVAVPNGNITISRTMSNKGMKLRDTGAGSVREIEKTMPVVP